MGMYLVNCKDPDEMLQNAPSHQGLHCLHRQKLSSVTKVHTFTS